MTPEEKSETDFMSGYKAAYRSLLAEALRHLAGDPDLDPARAVLQLHDARVQAKLLCERIGVEFDPKLHLGDIIEKRIGRAETQNGLERGSRIPHDRVKAECADPEAITHCDRFFTSAHIDALTATPDNLRASLATHGHVVFVLCLDGRAEEQRLMAAGIDTTRIKFVVAPKIPRCEICGDLAEYATPRRASGIHPDEYIRRCYRHRKTP